MNSNISIKKLFERIDNIVNLMSERDFQSEMRGEKYNIFQLLGVKTDETHLHSALLADLLNPNGSHTLGSKPLQRFIELCGYNYYEKFDYNDVMIDTEFSIGNKDKCTIEGGRLDILIRSGNNVIVIENKIHAQDQENQLVRYYNYCKKHYTDKTFVIFYLTLDGNEASLRSTKGELEEGKHYHSISYDVEISEWISYCIEIASDKPLVRGTLVQYLNLIKELTNNNMDKDLKQQIYKLMAENVASARLIYDNFDWGFRKYLVQTYVIEPLKTWAIQKDYDIIIGRELANQGAYEGFAVKYKNFESWIAFEFQEADFKCLKVGELKSNGLYLLDAGNDTRQSLIYEHFKLNKYPNWSLDIAENIINFDVLKYLEEIIEKELSEFQNDRIDKFS